MSALSADHCRIFAGFDAKVAARRSDDGFISIGTSALPGCFEGILQAFKLLFLVQVQLGEKYDAPHIQPDWGLNS